MSGYFVLFSFAIRMIDPYSYSSLFIPITFFLRKSVSVIFVPGTIDLWIHALLLDMNLIQTNESEERETGKRMS